MSFWTQLAIQCGFFSLILGMVSYFTAKKAPDQHRKIVMITFILIVAIGPMIGPKWSDNPSVNTPAQNPSGLHPTP